MEKQGIYGKLLARSRERGKETGLRVHITDAAMHLIQVYIHGCVCLCMQERGRTKTKRVWTGNQPQHAHIFINYYD